MNMSGFIHRWKVRAGEPHDDTEEDPETRPDDEWLEPVLVGENGEQ